MSTYNLLTLKKSQPISWWSYPEIGCTFAAPRRLLQVAGPSHGALTRLECGLQMALNRTLLRSVPFARKSNFEARLRAEKKLSGCRGEPLLRRFIVSSF